MTSRPFQLFMGSLLVLPLALSLACAGNGMSYNPPPAAPSTDVYVAGSADLKTDTGFNHVAVIWKNGIAVNLTDGKHDAKAIAATVAATTLYVVGYENNGTADVARIWTCDTAKPFLLKSFTATALTDGTNDARAQHLLVSGTDLYVAGSEARAGVDVAKVWKHDAAAPFADQSFTSADLTAGNNDASAFAMASDGSKLYVAGYAGDGTNDISTLWNCDLAAPFASEAFAAMPLASGTTSYANDVHFAGGRVWVAESYYANGSDRPPQAWLLSLDPANLTPGVPFTSYLLDGGNLGSEAFAVTESNGTLYVAGYEAYATGRQAQIWRLDPGQVPKLTTLTNSSYGAEAMDVAVVGGVVYAAGFDAQPLVAPPPALPYAKAMSWQDGVASAFTDGTSEAKGYGIFVQRN